MGVVRRREDEGERVEEYEGLRRKVCRIGRVRVVWGMDTGSQGAWGKGYGESKRLG